MDTDYGRRVDRARGLIQLRDKKESFKAVSELLEEFPDDPMLLKLAGDAMAWTYPGFATCFYARAAMLLDEGPEKANALCNLGFCLDQRHPMEAKRYYLASAQRDPDSPDTMANLATTCASLGEHEEALEWGRKALAIDPGNGLALANTSMSLLATGDWREGWKRYRHLMGMPPRVERFYKVDGNDIPRLEWGNDGRGIPVPGKVVVYGEQGLGDEILFLSMLPKRPFSAAGGCIETTKRLEGLFRRSFPKWTVYGTLTDKERDWAAREGITHKLEMGALGEFFAHGPFREKRYLDTCETRRDMWRGELSGNRLNVGLAWTGGKWTNGRGWRSCSPHVLRPMIDAHRDINFVSLEYLPHARVDGVSEYPWCTTSQDMDNVAALIDSLDLVITVTTTVVDLAGALGKPCWCLVPKRVSWRFGTEAMGENMHFYASVKCYRQKADIDWSPVVERISADLHQWKGQYVRAA